MTPSPFQVAQTIGNKLGQIPVNQADRSAIDEIMERASKTQNPADMEQILGDVIKNVSPDRRQAVLGAVTQKAKELQEQQVRTNTNRSYNKLAEEFDKMPGQHNKMIASIFRADLPKDERVNAIKLMMAADPAKKNQQTRLERDSVLRAYNSRIKEINEEMKTQFSYQPAYKENEKLRAALQAERDELLDFKVFQDNKKKTPWDPSNPEHIEKLREYEKKFNGDRQKINEALAEEFTIVNA